MLFGNSGSSAHPASGGGDQLLAILPTAAAQRDDQVDNWESEAACAKEVAHALGIGVTCSRCCR